MKTLQYVSLREWDERILECELSSLDRILIRQFAKSGASGMRLEELKSGLRIQSTSSIGVVRLDTIEIRVEPKLAGNNVRVVEMLELASSIDLLRRYQRSHELLADDQNLFDLIVLLLVSETERLIRGGLLSSYREEEDLLPVIRGRFLGDRQLLQRYGMLDKLHCRFDDLSHDIPENQVLAMALAHCQSWVVNPTLRHRVRTCAYDLLNSCNMTFVDHAKLRYSIVYDRLNQHYRAAHELCWLILEQTGIKDFESRGRTSCFSFLLNMNRLFEQFVEVLVRKQLPPLGYSVRSQQKVGSIIHDAATNKSYAKVIPDFRVLTPNGESFCIDAKYKLYDNLKVSNADIYQSFLYSFAFASLGQAKLAFLVFPSNDSEGRIHRLKIKCLDGSVAYLSAVGIHIPTILDQLPKGGNAIEQLTSYLTQSL